MEALLMYLFTAKKHYHECRHVDIHPSLLTELCDKKNAGIIVDRYNDILDLIATPVKASQTRIELYSIADIYRHMNQPSSHKLPSRPSSNKLAASKEFLERLEIAAQQFLELHGTVRIIKQQELLNLYRSKDDNRITQSALSNMINRNMEAHKITIEIDPGAYRTLLERVNPFRKLRNNDDDLENEESVIAGE